MDVYTVSFFGHRYVDNPFAVEREIEKLVRQLIDSKEYVEFLVGRDGDFDQLVSSTVLRCKRNYRNDNAALVWVMPYEKAEYKNDPEAFHSYYDEVEICAESASKHFKSAYQIRNRSMIDRSDLVVFYVEHESGGAYQSMCYAKKMEKPIINFAP